MPALVNYLTIDDFTRAATHALRVKLATACSMTNEALAGSAMAAPAAGFGGEEKYPQFATKAAVLLQAAASNHPLPDGNKRTALLCTILFANLNGYQWKPPLADDLDGEETAEVVDACATRSVPLGALSAWVNDRLAPVSPALP
jgi:death-on-curing protein